MLTGKPLELYLPMLIRPWSPGGREPGRPYYAIQLADAVGAGGSIGWTPAYDSPEALQRNHPNQEELFFSGDTRQFPAIFRPWTAEYYPAASVGHCLVYGTVDALRKDHPAARHTVAALVFQEFRLPLAATDSRLKDFLRNPAKDRLISKSLSNFVGQSSG